MMRWYVLVVVGTLGFGPALVWAANSLPTTITADRMQVQQMRHTAVFVGEVVLHHEDFEMKCDRLVVHYDQKHNGELRQAEAYGHVRIVHGQTRGSANEAKYNQQLGNVTLIGNAKLSEPGRTVQGDKIVHDLRKKTTQVEQTGPGRVHLHIDSSNGASKTSPPKGNP